MTTRGGDTSEPAETRRKEAGQLSERQADELLADDIPVVILVDELSEDGAADAAATQAHRTARAGAPEGTSTAEGTARVVNLGTVAARTATPTVVSSEGPSSAAVTAEAISEPTPGEDFEDLITEVEANREIRQDVKARGVAHGTKRPDSRKRDEADWSLGELEEELDEEIRNDLSPWSARMGIRWLGGAIALLTIPLLGLLLFIGRSYYELPVARRAFHHLHEVLRPSGSLGLTLGIGGLVFMLISLVYLIRKQFVSWARFGSLQGWLGLHIFTGFLGPALVLFHSAFVPYSALGFLAFGSMLVVVISGVVGRYVYVYCPKTLEGRELEFEDVRQRLAFYSRKLTQLGIDASLLRIDEPTSNKKRRPWLIQAVIGVVCGDRESKQDFARLSSAISKRRDLPVPLARILILARRLSRERQWLVRYNELRKLMGAWRFFHRWLAIVMLLAIFYHIVIAVVFGDLWIFGGKN